MFELLWELTSKLEDDVYQRIGASLGLLPSEVRDRLSATMPYWADRFAPGVYFAPPPTIPSETGKSNGHWIYHVWGSQAMHLLPLTNDAEIEGVVRGLEPFNPGYSWKHQTFYLEPDNKKLLNEFSNKVGASWPGMAETIKCETPVNDRNLPEVGERVKVWGAFCLDLAWGWTDIAVRAWARA